MITQAQCLGRYGNPTEHGFEARWITRITPPFAMHMGDIPIKQIAINREAAPALLRALNRVKTLCGSDPKLIAAAHADRFSGAYAVRNMRGKNAISMHAYGLAIDLDAENNQMGWNALRTFFKPQSLVVQAFKAEGWVWGGDWTGRRDAMHLQYVEV